MSAFAERRAAVLERLDDGVMIVPAAVHARRNSDSEYEYRQSSDFYYLTGFTEPEAVLVLAPHRASERVTLFLRQRDRDKEIWNGKRLGVDAARAELAVDAAYPIDELAQRLPDALAGARRAFVALGEDEAFDRTFFTALRAARAQTRRSGFAPEAIVEPSTILHEMRLVKDADEIALMRRAAQITRLGHEAGMRATRPGMREYELQGIIELAYRTNGATTAYTSIVAGGDNATILHYNTNREELRAGELVLVDSAAELGLYASDVTRTWPVDGRFTAEQRAIYDIVLAAQKAAIAEVRPGAHVKTAHEAALRVLSAGLIDLGLLQGSLDEALERETYKPFYMHGTGHWIGLDVHDVGAYRLRDGTTHRPLEPGMVVTVEPGLYVQRDLDVDDRFKGIGVRIEDDVLCSADGPDVLNDGTPKEVDEIEAIVGSGALAHAR